MRISQTAKAVTLGRALAHLRGHLEDPFAEKCLSPEAVRCLHRYASSEGLSLRCLRDVILAEMADDMMGPRTRFIDEGLERLPRGYQCVILGAGYDSRAHRLKALSTSTVFEVDLTDIQETKKVLARPWPHVSKNLKYVSCDITNGHLRQKLEEAGFLCPQPTAWVVEGLLTYVSQQQVCSLLAEISALSAPESKVWLTYNEDGFSRRLISAVTRPHGEPHQFWSRPGDMACLVKAFGFRVDCDVNGVDRARFYQKPTMVDRLWTRLHHVLVATRMIQTAES